MFIALAVSPDGRNLYGNNGKAVFVLDAATGAEERKIELPGTVQGPMALSPDGATLFLTDSTANAVDLVNPASGAVTVVPVPYSPTSVVVLP
jgi:DNA-binding beta-propeller fold protein YncE